VVPYGATAAVRKLPVPKESATAPPAAGSQLNYHPHHAYGLLPPPPGYVYVRTAGSKGKQISRSFM
jgi:hypothetical protein